MSSSREWFRSLPSSEVASFLSTLDLDNNDEDYYMKWICYILWMRSSRIRSSSTTGASPSDTTIAVEKEDNSSELKKNDGTSKDECSEEAGVPSSTTTQLVKDETNRDLSCTKVDDDWKRCVIREIMRHGSSGSTSNAASTRHDDDNDEKNHSPKSRSCPKSIRYEDCGCCWFNKVSQVIQSKAIASNSLRRHCPPEFRSQSTKEPELAASRSSSADCATSDTSPDSDVATTPSKRILASLALLPMVLGTTTSSIAEKRRQEVSSSNSSSKSTNANEETPRQNNCKRHVGLTWDPNSLNIDEFFHVVDSFLKDTFMNLVQPAVVSINDKQHEGQLTLQQQSQRQQQQYQRLLSSFSSSSSSSPFLRWEPTTMVDCSSSSFMNAEKAMSSTNDNAGVSTLDLLPSWFQLYHQYCCCSSLSASSSRSSSSGQETSRDENELILLFLAQMEYSLMLRWKRLWSNEMFDKSQVSNNLIQFLTSTSPAAASSSSPSSSSEKMTSALVKSDGTSSISTSYLSSSSPEYALQQRKRLYRPLWLDEKSSRDYLEQMSERLEQWIRSKGMPRLQSKVVTQLMMNDIHFEDINRSSISTSNMNSTARTSIGPFLDFRILDEIISTILPESIAPSDISEEDEEDLNRKVNLLLQEFFDLFFDQHCAVTSSTANTTTNTSTSAVLTAQGDVGGTKKDASLDPIDETMEERCSSAATTTTGETIGVASGNKKESQKATTTLSVGDAVAPPTFHPRYVHTSTSSATSRSGGGNGGGDVENKQRLRLVISNLSLIDSAFTNANNNGSSSMNNHTTPAGVAVGAAAQPKKSTITSNAASSSKPSGTTITTKGGNNQDEEDDELALLLASSISGSGKGGNKGCGGGGNGAKKKGKKKKKKNKGSGGGGSGTSSSSKQQQSDQPGNNSSSNNNTKDKDGSSHADKNGLNEEGQQKTSLAKSTSSLTPILASEEIRVPSMVVSSAEDSKEKPNTTDTATDAAGGENEQQTNAEDEDEAIAIDNDEVVDDRGVDEKTTKTTKKKDPTMTSSSRTRSDSTTRSNSESSSSSSSSTSSSSDDDDSAMFLEHFRRSTKKQSTKGGSSNKSTTATTVKQQRQTRKLNKHKTVKHQADEEENDEGFITLHKKNSKANSTNSRTEKKTTTATSSSKIKKDVLVESGGGGSSSSGAPLQWRSVTGATSSNTSKIASSSPSLLNTTGVASNNSKPLPSQAGHSQRNTQTKAANNKTEIDKDRRKSEAATATAKHNEIKKTSSETTERSAPTSNIQSSTTVGHLDERTAKASVRKSDDNEGSKKNDIAKDEETAAEEEETWEVVGKKTKSRSIASTASSTTNPTTTTSTNKFQKTTSASGSNSTSKLSSTTTAGGNSTIKQHQHPQNQLKHRRNGNVSSSSSTTGTSHSGQQHHHHQQHQQGTNNKWQNRSTASSAISNSNVNVKNATADTDNRNKLVTANSSSSITTATTTDKQRIRAPPQSQPPHHVVVTTEAAGASGSSNHKKNVGSSSPAIKSSIAENKSASSVREGGVATAAAATATTNKIPPSISTTGVKKPPAWGNGRTLVFQQRRGEAATATATTLKTNVPPPPSSKTNVTMEATPAVVAKSLKKGWSQVASAGTTSTSSTASSSTATTAVVQKGGLSAAQIVSKSVTREDTKLTTGSTGTVKSTPAATGTTTKKENAWMSNKNPIISKGTAKESISSGGKQSLGLSHQPGGTSTMKTAAATINSTKHEQSHHHQQQHQHSAAVGSNTTTTNNEVESESGTTSAMVSVPTLLGVSSDNSAASSSVSSSCLGGGGTNHHPPRSTGGLKGKEVNVVTSTDRRKQPTSNAGTVTATSQTPAASTNLGDGHGSNRNKCPGHDKVTSGISSIKSTTAEEEQEDGGFYGSASSSSVHSKKLLHICDQLTKDIEIFMQRRASTLKYRRQERLAFLQALETEVLQIWSPNTSNGISAVSSGEGGGSTKGSSKEQQQQPTSPQSIVASFAPRVEVMGSCATQLDLPSSDLDVVICGLPVALPTGAGASPTSFSFTMAAASSSSNAVGALPFPTTTTTGSYIQPKQSLSSPESNIHTSDRALFPCDDSAASASTSGSVTGTTTTTTTTATTTTITAQGKAHSQQQQQTAKTSNQQQQQPPPPPPPPPSVPLGHSNSSIHYSPHSTSASPHAFRGSYINPSSARVVRLALELEKQPWAAQVKPIPTAKVPVIKMLVDPSKLKPSTTNSSEESPENGSSNAMKDSSPLQKEGHDTITQPWMGADLLNGLLAVDITFEGPGHGGVGSTQYALQIVDEACREHFGIRRNSVATMDRGGDSSVIDADEAPLVQLILVLKELLAQRRMNEPFSGGLSSYSILLMVCAALREYRVFQDEIVFSAHQSQLMQLSQDEYGMSGNYSDYPDENFASYNTNYDASFSNSGNAAQSPYEVQEAELVNEHEPSTNSKSAIPENRKVSSWAAIAKKTTKDTSKDDVSAPPLKSKSDASKKSKDNKKLSYADKVTGLSQMNSKDNKKGASSNSEKQSIPRHSNAQKRPQQSSLSGGESFEGSVIRQSDTIDSQAVNAEPFTPSSLVTAGQDGYTMIDVNQQGSGSFIGYDMSSNPHAMYMPIQSSDLFRLGVGEFRDVLEILCRGEQTSGKLLMYFFLLYGKIFDAQSTVVDILSPGPSPFVSRHLVALGPTGVDDQMMQHPVALGGTNVDPLTGAISVDPVVVYDPLKGEEGKNVARSCFAWYSIQQMFGQCYAALLQAGDASPTRVPPSEKSDSDGDTALDKLESSLPLLAMLLSY